MLYGLRSLLYGGAFVFTDDEGLSYNSSQIPAVRRGFCCAKIKNGEQAEGLRSLLYGGVFVAVATAPNGKI